jgi:uncharacterized damage-inducible protein DinB
MPFSQMLLPEFDAEMASTRKMLERFPDGDNDYKPHEKSMTLGRLASHVAELPGWAIMTLDREVLVLDENFKPYLAGSRAELVELLDKNVTAAREKIAAASDEDWQKIWTLRYKGHDVLSMPRSAVMRSVVMNHLIHHRAQLGVYFRLKDVAIPGMYGPSADDPGM